MTLFLVMMTVFVILDAFALTLLIGPFFRKRLGDELRDRLFWLPVVLFYVFYVAGLMWFAAMPAVEANRIWLAFVSGGAIGFLAYGTYEFTNLATLRRWSLGMVALDLAWGTLLSGLTAGLGVIIWKMIAH